jgi:hypothetical protein
LAAQRLKERNEKYLEDLKKKRDEKLDKDEIEQKLKLESKQKLREQIFKKNAEVI